MAQQVRKSPRSALRRKPVFPVRKVYPPAREKPQTKKATGYQQRKRQSKQHDEDDVTVPAHPAVRLSAGVKMRSHPLRQLSRRIGQADRQAEIKQPENDDWRAKCFHG